MPYISQHHHTVVTREDETAFSLEGLGQCGFKLLKVRKALEEVLVTTLLRKGMAAKLPRILKAQRQSHIENSLFRQLIQGINVHSKSQ